MKGTTMSKSALTPTERLILLSLAVTPNQTAKQLLDSTGCGTERAFLSQLRLLTLTRKTVATTVDGVSTYSVVKP